MHTVNAYTTTSTTELRAPTTIERSYAADEPSHIHLPRPGRVVRPDAEPRINQTHITEEAHR